VGIVFANPWGLAALAAVPALVAIHCLRRRARHVRASTLFLLDHAAPRPTGGTRLDRFRQSLPFWMQLLAILAATWLLAEPRWIRADARQTVSVVLDGSASMAAGLDETKRALSAALGRVERGAARTDWRLLETGPRRAPLHAGDRLDGLLAALDGWRPSQGSHDFRPTLAVASSLVPAGSGLVVLVTDRPVEVPAGVAVLSVGRRIDNVGIAGADCLFADGEADEAAAAGPRWRALVTNHGATAAERSLTVHAGGADGLPENPAAPPLRLTLEPGATEAVEGPWPAGAERLLLRLDADRFPLDDRAPLVLPRPRTVRVAVRAGTPGGELLARLVAAAGDVVPTDDVAAADLVVEVAGTEGTLPAVQIAPAPEDAGDAGAALDPEPPAATDEPLVRDLAWAGLLTGPSRITAADAGDQVLLWKGSRPLVLVRTSIRADGTVRRALVLGFDPEGTNAERLPALVVLLARWVDRVRDGIDPAGADRGWAANVETDQTIPLPARPLRLEVTPTAEGAAAREEPFARRAPRETSFFTVRDGDGTRLFSGAALGLDPREGDFRDAAPVDTLTGLERERALVQSVADPWAPGWIALLAAALLAAWARSTAGAATPRGTR
jgi:hypothetical protein